ncbi:MAG: hypothetical protein V1922_06100, partial [bacterium]
MGIIFLGGLLTFSLWKMSVKEVLAVPGTLAIPGSQTFTTTTMNVTNITLGGTNISATGAELNFLHGVTSGIQDQLNLKAPKASPTFTGTVTGPTFVGALTGNATTATNQSGGTVNATTGNFSGELDLTGGTGTGYSTAPIEVRTTLTPRIAF